MFVMNPLPDFALDQLFKTARSQNGFIDKPVPDAQLHAIYELMKMGPTAANSCPARLVFVKSADAKEKLRPCLAQGNVAKSMSAPVVAIIAMDLAFYEKLPYLLPHVDAKSWFVGNDQKIRESAFRDSSLQGAYLIMAARALGLDCGPMVGFDAAMTDTVFFAGTSYRSNFLCTLGYGDPTKVFGRSPRLAFDEAARIA
jgi:3-hydroxypropanoate dehydrogenase